MKKLSRFAIASPLLFIAYPIFADAAADCKDAGGVYVSGALGVKNNCLGSTDVNPIIALVGYAVQFLSGIFGLLLVLMVVISGLQFVLSGSSPDTAKSAKDRLRNAFTGLVIFIFMYAAINFLLPPSVRIFK